jgi:hypothetical protein
MIVKRPKRKGLEGCVDNLRVVFGAPQSPVFGAWAENAPKFLQTLLYMSLF